VISTTRPDCSRSASSKSVIWSAETDSAGLMSIRIGLSSVPGGMTVGTGGRGVERGVAVAVAATNGPCSTCTSRHAASITRSKSINRERALLLMLHSPAYQWNLIFMVQPIHIGNKSDDGHADFLCY